MFYFVLIKEINLLMSMSKRKNQVRINEADDFDIRTSNRSLSNIFGFSDVPEDRKKLITNNKKTAKNEKDKRE